MEDDATTQEHLDETAKTDQWGYNVTVENAGFKNLANLEVKDMIFFKHEQLGVKGPARKESKSGTYTIPEIDSLGKDVVQHSICQAHEDDSNRIHLLRQWSKTDCERFAYGDMDSRLSEREPVCGVLVSGGAYFPSRRGSEALIVNESGGLQTAVAGRWGGMAHGPKDPWDVSRVLLARIRSLTPELRKINPSEPVVRHPPARAGRCSTSLRGIIFAPGRAGAEGKGLYGAVWGGGKGKVALRGGNFEIGQKLTQTRRGIICLAAPKHPLRLCV